MAIKSKKRVIILVAVIAVLAIGVTVAVIRTNSIPHFEAGYEEMEEIVQLETNNGTLNEWTLAMENSDIAEMVEKTSEEQNPGEVGSLVKLNYRFEGRKPGRTHIYFRYGNFADGHVEQENVYLVEVDAKLHIKITEE
jgi:predicted secreted protein